MRPVPRFVGRGVAIAIACSAVLGLSSRGGRPAAAQSVCLPLPRLLTTMPMGGRAGTTVDVTVAGAHCDGAGELRFSHPGLTAVPKRADDGAVVPDVFVVTIAADVPTGAYEAALVAPAGCSSSRVFSVGMLPEIVQPTAPQDGGPADIAVGSIVNGVARPQAIDVYRCEARAGRRLLVECAAPGIDSRMQPVVVVATADGRDLVVERRGGVLDFTPPADGPLLVKVHDLCFRGGREFFYRLVVQEAAADAEPIRHPVAAGVASYSWPPVGLAASPTRIESDAGDAEGAGRIERIDLPCDIGGRFFPAADVDTFEFTATAGDVWWIEVASQRLGAPTAPAAAVVRVVADEAGERLVDVLELAEIAAPIKPSSNFYSYDGPPYDAGSPDLLGRLAIEETGTYRISLRDRFGGTRSEPRSVWRMVIRRGQPDFAIVGWGLHMELRNGDRNDLSKPAALRRGSTVAVEVAAFRRDGFDGPIDLDVEGLPSGVTARGVRIPSGKTRGLVFLTAAIDAAVPPTPLRIVGRATVEDAAIERDCRLASVAWPVKDHSQEIPLTRLVTDPCVSVSAIEDAPLTITAGGEAAAEIEAVAGSKVTVPLALVRRAEFSGGLIRLKAFGAGFESFPVLEVPLTADAAEAVLDLEALKVPPGRHTVAFYGTAIVKYVPPAAPAAADGKAADVKPVDTAEIVISTPISLIVTPVVPQQAAAAAADKERS